MARKLAFTQRQLSRIVVLLAKYQPLKKVGREFQKEFHLAKHPQLVPSLTDVIPRSHKTDLVKPCSGGGLENSVRTSENILCQGCQFKNIPILFIFTDMNNFEK